MNPGPNASWSERASSVAERAGLIAQAALAAGIAYWIARDILGHHHPFVAPLSSVVSLGVSYGHRVTRIAEATLGICLGLLLAAVVVQFVGGGVWQLVLVVALAISIALFLGGGPLLVSQAAVQGIVFVSVLPTSDAVPLRCTEAMVGGGVAMVAATLVPRAVLRTPADHIAGLADTISELLRGAAWGIRHPEVDAMMLLLSDARSTDELVADLRRVTEESLSAVRASPYHRHQRNSLYRFAELVEPMDLALRNTRVLVRRVTVAAVRGESISADCALLCNRLAEQVDALRDSVADPRRPHSQPELLAFGRALAPVANRGTAELLICSQLRAIVADLLRATGMSGLESTRALVENPGHPPVGDAR